MNITRAWATLRALKRSLKTVGILFVKQGFLRSVLTGKPVSGSGEPIPWFSYPAIEYLSQFDFSGKRIFEYGCGNSSLFWSARARRVAAVESDPAWYERVSAMRPSNLLLNLETERGRYISSIGQFNEAFDVIVIDGMWRNACAAYCLDYLADDGMVIFDNSDRHYEGCNHLRARGFFQVDFSGFSPINAFTTTTSLFIRPSTQWQRSFALPSPVGGLRDMAGTDD